MPNDPKSVVQQMLDHVQSELRQGRTYTLELSSEKPNQAYLMQPVRGDAPKLLATLTVGPTGTVQVVWGEELKPLEYNPSASATRLRDKERVAEALLKALGIEGDRLLISSLVDNNAVNVAPRLGIVPTSQASVKQSVSEGKLAADPGKTPG